MEGTIKRKRSSDHGASAADDTSDLESDKERPEEYCQGKLDHSQSFLVFNWLRLTSCPFLPIFCVLCTGFCLWLPVVPFQEAIFL